VIELNTEFEPAFPVANVPTLAPPAPTVIVYEMLLLINVVPVNHPPAPPPDP